MSDPAAPPPVDLGVSPAPGDAPLVTLTDGPSLLVTLTPAEDPDPMNNAYKPSQAVTLTATFTDPATGNPTDPTVGPVLTVFFPDGSTATATVVRRSTGVYQGTIVVPATMTMGSAAYRWQTTDANNPTNNTCNEGRFDILALDF